MEATTGIDLPEAVRPETIRGAQFRERLRGYSPDDVDAFLERVATGVEVLEERLRQPGATRAFTAPVTDGADEVSRMLRLAQRTADMAVQEARDEAGRIVDDARTEADAIVAAAKADACREAEEARARIWEDVQSLERARDQLTADVADLLAYLEAERARARRFLTEAVERVAEALPTASPPPRLHDVDIGAVHRLDPDRARARTGDTLSELQRG